MATNNIPKPTLSVAINEIKMLFAKVKHTQKQLKNKILRFKDDIEKSISEVKCIIEDNSHKLVSTFFEGQKRKLVTFNRGSDFVDIEKDIKLLYDQFGMSMTHIDGFMTLTDLIDKMTNEHNNNVRGGGVGVGVGRRVPQFLQKLYDMVEKEELDSFVSWNLPNRDSFIIRDINEFATQVLPMYFTHSNFSSFNRQLNIYGFEKIGWDHEYANEWFQGGRYDLLVNIKRRDKNPLSTRSIIQFSTIEQDNVRSGGVGVGVGVGSRVPHFLQKLYDMVENEETDSFVSWNLPDRDSFIIRDINEFSTQVLPMYFTHSNFSSFNRQLNNYGFEKISWEHHKYVNEWFQGGRYDLLVNIKRRNKKSLSTRSTIQFSAMEAEMFKDQLKTIEQEQENKIICLSNYQEEMKRSIHEFKEIVVNMANIVNKMILTSNENLENFKKPKMDIEDHVIGNHMASTDNNEVEAQPYFLDVEIDLEALRTNMEMEETTWIVEREMDTTIDLGRETEIERKFILDYASCL